MRELRELVAECAVIGVKLELDSERMGEVWRVLYEAYDGDDPFVGLREHPIWKMVLSEVADDVLWLYFAGLSSPAGSEYSFLLPALSELEEHAGRFVGEQAPLRLGWEDVFWMFSSGVEDLSAYARLAVECLPGVAAAALLGSSTQAEGVVRDCLGELFEAGRALLEVRPSLTPQEARSVCEAVEGSGRHRDRAKSSSL